LRQNAEDGEELIHKIFTQEVLIAQEKAKILFEPFFDKFNLDGFNNTWERYTKSSYDYRESNILPLVNKTSILS
jgi:hypothetical protein